MSRSRKFWRKVVSIMLTVLIVVSGLSQPVFAEGTDSQSAITAEEAANVSGNLTQGGEPLPGVTFSIQNTTDQSWYDTSSDEAGKFTFSLPDGNYLLQGVWIPSEEKWYQLDKTISVIGGLLEGGVSLDIDLPAKVPNNVTGNLTKEGQPLPEVTFSIHTTSEPEQWFDTTTNSTGQFGFTLSDGEYKVEGVWVPVEEKWYQLGQTFKVVDGKLEGLDQLTIDLIPPVEQPKHSVSGTLTQAGLPVTDILFSLHTTGEEDEWYSATSDQDGKFVFQLPEGDYEIEGIWVPAQSKWYQLDNVFSVTGEKVLNIDLPVSGISSEVKGTVTKEGTPVANVAFSVHSTGTNPIWYDTATDAAGNFTFNGMPDGEYQLEGVWIAEESKWYFLQLKFSVLAGKLSGSESLAIDLSAQEKSIKGRVLKGTAAVADTWVSAHTVGEKETWYDVKTDATGTFKLPLPDGEYLIEGIWIAAEETWYPHSVAFTVQDGKLAGQTELLINLQAEAADNVTGTVFDGQTPLANASLYLENADDLNDFYGVDVNTDGQFSIQLGDGNYYVVSVSASTLDESLYIYKKFSVVDGKLVIDDLAAEVLDVTIPPASLALQLSKNGAPLKTNGVYIFNVEHGFGYWGYPNSQGRVTYRVPDGTYEVEGYYGLDSFYNYMNQTVEVVNGTTTPNPFTINVESNEMLFGDVRDENGVLPNVEFWIEDVDNFTPYLVQADVNGRYSVNLPNGNYFIHEIYKGTTPYAAVDFGFTVTGGKVYINDQEVNEFDIIVPAKTLTGQLLAGGNPLAGELYFEREINGWTYYYSGATDSNGNFALRVPDGTYTITSVSANLGADYYEVNPTVNVVNGVTQPSSFVLDVNQGNLDGSLADENGPLANADFFIDSVDGSSYYWVLTDENGKFSSFVPDGDYYVHQVWSETSEGYVDVFFSVVDGKIQMNGAPVDVLALTLPGETLQAQLLAVDTPLAGDVYVTREVNGVLFDYWAVTDENGAFTLRVGDGVYSIESLFSNGGMIDIFTDVEVKDGTTNPDPFIIDISGF